MAETSKNLRPCRTKEEARERGKNGGIASGITRRKRRALKESLKLFMELPLKDGNTECLEEIKSFLDLKDKNLTVQDALLFAQVQKAMKGDTRAAEYIRDTIGEKPAQSVDMNAEVTGGDFVLRIGDGEDADD